MSELLHNFLKNREKLDSALRNGLLLTNSYSDRVGLINQGATCYLNSLLQCLFYNLSFRVLILQAKPDSAILIALQELFAQLQLSSSSAVNTKDLVTAFGWARGQVFEQHDVHELFSLLLDALGNCSTALSTQLPDLFQGSISDVLLCPTCDYKRENVSAFLNISLDLSIPDKGINVKEAPLRFVQPNVNDASLLDAQQRVELSVLLKLHMQIEILDPDNMWQCSGCNDRVQALKYHEYTVLPKSLMIHFKRFRYNTVLRKREKVKMPVYFPCLLDTAVLTHPVQGTCAGKHVESPNISITDTTPPNTDKSGKCDVSSAIGDFYRLHSVLLHTGTANGGHYKAYVLDSLSGHWLECNDASVSEMTTIEEASLFLQKESISCSMLCSPSPENLKNHTDGVVEARNMRDDRNMGLGAPAHGENEILPAAVEPTVESSKSDRECIGGRIRQRKFALLSDDVLRENAYMLLYHKISKDCMKEVSKNVENDEEIKYSSCGERKEAMMLREACLAAIPMPLQMEINSKNKELMELRSLYEMQKKVLTVKVLYNYSVVEAIKKQYLMERTGGTGLPSVRSSTSTERVLNNEVKIRNGNTKGKIQLQHMTVAVLITDTMDSLLDQICSLLDIYTTATSSTTTEEGVKADQKVTVSIDTEEGTSIHSRKYFHRLRAFDPVSGQDGETFGSRGAESFEKLGFRVCHTNGSAAQPCVTLKFESRREDHPIFSEMKKNDLCLNVIVWSTEVSAAYTICYEANKSHPYSAHDQVISKNHSPWKNHTGSVSDDNIIIDANDDYDYNTNAPESEGYKAINPDQTGEHHTTDSLHESEAVLTAATRNVLVPGELNATLGELRSTVAKLLNILESDLILIFNDGRSHSELENGRDSQTLGRAFGIKKGDIVFAEIKIKPSIIDENIVCSSGDCMLPSDITHAPLSVEYVSEALTYLRYLSTSMTIKFNDPRIHKIRSNSNSILKGTGMIVHSNVTETEESIPNEYLTLKTSSDTLLKDVKIMIADILGIPLPRNSQNVVRGVEKEEFEEEEASDFYMAKSSSAFASQYNDFSRSLSDLGLFDQSVIYLQMGRGCLQGEHILRFEVETYGCSASTTTSMSCDVPINLLTLVPVSVHLSDPVSESESKSPRLVTDTQLASSFNSIVSMKIMESNGIASSSNASSSDSSNVMGIDMEKNRRNINTTRIIPLGQMIIHEQSSVLTLKEHLLSSWDSFKSENLLPDKPLSAHHIRIRDGKAGNSISLGTVLRNERILSKCLLGLTNGRRIVVQVLSFPEIIRPADWVLTVRLVTYSSFPRSLSPPVNHISTLIPEQFIDDTKDIIENTTNDIVRSMKDSKKQMNPSLVMIKDLTATSEFTMKKVHRPSDMPISRAATVRDLYQAILNLYPHLREPYQSATASSDCPESSIFAPITTGGSDGRIYSTNNNDSDIDKDTDTDKGLNPLISSGEGETSFPEKDYLSIAEGFSTGPPLSFKSSLKLSWDPSVITTSPDLRIDHPSLGLRDGSLLIIRGSADWQRALTEYALQGNSVTLPSEAEKVPHNPIGSYLPPWKSKPTILKKKTNGLSPAMPRSGLSNPSVNSIGVRALLNGGVGRRRVEKGLSLGTNGGHVPNTGTGTSRQGTLIQSALDLDCKVNQNSESLPLNLNSERDTNIVSKNCLPSYSTSHTVRRSISDSDVISGVLGIDLDQTPFRSLSRPSSRRSFSTFSSSSGAGMGSGGGTEPDSCIVSKELRVPVAPIKMVRALKKAVQGT